ncbi:MAG: hypothetical protein Kow0069_12300 [Promethearchaeota archaeon]
MAIKKFALLGLDNAGKTSVWTAFREKFHYEEKVRALTPTMSVAYSRFNFLNHSVSIWDMGGQIRFRNRYVQHAEYYLADVDLIFYVIDVQDPDRFEESLEYVTSVFNYLISINHVVPVLLCFHKCDPGLVDASTIDSVIERWQERLSELFPGWYFVVAETSIYDAQSIVRAMSFAMSLFLPTVEEVGEVLNNLRGRTDAYCVLLLTASGEILGEAYAGGFGPDQQAEVFNVVRECLAPFHESRERRELAKRENGLLSFGRFKGYEHAGAFLGERYFLDAMVPASEVPSFRQLLPSVSRQLTQLLEDVR